MDKFMPAFLVILFVAVAAGALYVVTSTSFIAWVLADIWRTLGGLVLIVLFIFGARRWMMGA